MSYLVIVPAGSSDSGKTKRWVLKNASNRTELGWVSWFGAFRKYTFNPTPGTTFDQACLREIADFIEQETKLHQK